MWFIEYETERSPKILKIDFAHPKKNNDKNTQDYASELWREQCEARIYIYLRHVGRMAVILTEDKYKLFMLLIYIHHTVRKLRAANWITCHHNMRKGDQGKKNVKAESLWFIVS